MSKKKAIFFVFHFRGKPFFLYTRSIFSNILSRYKLTKQHPFHDGDDDDDDDFQK